MNKIQKIVCGLLFVTGLFGMSGERAAYAAEAPMKLSVTVQEGDTLTSLAQKYGGNEGLWKYTNNLTTDKLVAGQKLNMPFPLVGLGGDLLGTEEAKQEKNQLAPAEQMAPKDPVTPVEQAAMAVDPAPQAPAAAPAPEAKEVAPAVAPAPAAVPAEPTVAGMAYSKKVDMRASSYGPGNIMWQWGGLTFSGTKVREGVIAVDPNVIPLGSKVYITGYNSPLLPDGGFVATAEDTGGAIKGNRVDIYIDASQQQLLQFGMQNVQLYVLK